MAPTPLPIVVVFLTFLSIFLLSVWQLQLAYAS
jgi:cytochrome oxidase assembly protein ShyY1